jgi:threonine/homoserine/homoserine lactone efflux protein
VFGIHHLPLFIVSGLVLNMLPGPDSLLVVTRSAGQGWRAGLAAAFGIGAGTMVHVCCAAIGLSAMLATSTAFAAVKYVGSAYILYMAISFLRMSPRDASATVSGPPLPYRSIVAQGFLTDVLNPKGMLFFVSFVPQFIDAGAAARPWAFLILGCIFNVNGMAWYAALAVFTEKARDRIRPSTKATRWLSGAAAGLFIWIGARLALANPS